MSKFLPLRILILNTLMEYNKTPFLIEEKGLQNEGMWTTFEWGSKEQILQKPNGLRLER